MGPANLLRSHKKVNISETLLSESLEARSHARLVEQEWPLVADRCKCMQDSYEHW